MITYPDGYVTKELKYCKDVLDLFYSSEYNSQEEERLRGIVLQKRLEFKKIWERTNN